MGVRRLGAALALTVVIAAGMVTFGPTVHASVPGSSRSIQVRCELLKAAIQAAIATFGADSALVLYLQDQYATYCGE